MHVELQMMIGMLHKPSGRGWMTTFMMIHIGGKRVYERIETEKEQWKINW